jgi:tight adherence protein B
MSDPDNLLLIVAVAVLIAAMLLLGQFAYFALTVREEDGRRELARRIGSLQERAVAPLVRFGRAAGPEGLAGYLDQTLRSAGSPYPMDVLMRRILFFGLGGALVAGVTLGGVLTVAGLFAGVLPVLRLSQVAEARTKRLAEQLPDGLDLLARSLQAGHGVGESLRLVAEEMPDPLATEFGRVFEEQNLGRDTRECFQNLCNRNPNSFDLRIFVSSVLLQRDTGGNLVEILQGIANTIRERFVFQGKVGALTSEARFTGYILGGLPFVIGTMIFIFSPDYIKTLFGDPLGHLLIVFGAVWFCIGVFIMREVAKVEL